MITPSSGDDEQWAIPSKEERAKADFRNRLIDEAHLELFMMWYAMGGINNPPSVLELCKWPAALQQDFMFLLRRMGELRKRHDTHKTKSAN